MHSVFVGLIVMSHFHAHSPFKRIINNNSYSKVFFGAFRVSMRLHVINKIKIKIKNRYDYNRQIRKLSKTYVMFLITQK